MLSGEHDAAARCVSINAGAGGVDGQDWARDADAHATCAGPSATAARSRCSTSEDAEQAGIRSAELAIAGRVRLRLPALERSACTAWSRSRRSTPTRGARPAFASVHGAARHRRRGHRHRGQRGRPRGRHVTARRRRRRSARQQDRLGGAPAPPADRHRRRLPGRALAAQEQGHGDAHAEGQAVGPRAAAPRGQSARPCRASARRSSGAARSARTCCSRTSRSTTTAPRSRARPCDAVLDGDLDEFIEAYLLQQSQSPAEAPS